ncbi:EsaB/YukD family protein [Nesterenkonia flava]|uniref:EsaB/YukD family protein n=1 Tax=Nesterenkonia flava TaxID=469799 RepID=A0ABU1FQQ4_9MICC|nr:EsaB/YukD family protein [Nesterenkonia flava]MDR5710948.1 EsaB/YukD family protein [Nesterenkonia flava]
MSGDYTRVTIAAGSRNIEALLPSRRPVAALMPEILRMSRAEGTAGDPRRLTLTPPGGPSLLPEQSLEAAHVRDGALLMLDQQQEAVPRPLVYDLSEESEDPETRVSDELTWQMSRLGSIGVTLVAGVAALLFLAEDGLPGHDSLWPLGLSALCLAVLAALPSTLLNADAELLILSAATLLVAYRWGWPDWPYAEWLPALWLVCSLLAWLSYRRRALGALMCASAAVLLGLLWWGTAQLVTHEHEVAAVTGIGSVILLGWAPRLALMLSGMNRLDDAIAAGGRPQLPEAERAYRNAHAGLAAAVVLCAVSMLLSVHLMLLSPASREAAPAGWTLALAALLTGITALRARSMPLAVERSILMTLALAAAVLLGFRVLDSAPQWLLVLLAVLVCLVGLTSRIIPLPEHVRARLRVIARRLELLATIALLPVGLGVFTIYPQLLETF